MNTITTLRTLIPEIALLSVQTILVFLAVALFLDSLASMRYRKKSVGSMWGFCITVAVLFLTLKL